MISGVPVQYRTQVFHIKSEENLPFVHRSDHHLSTTDYFRHMVSVEQAKELLNRFKPTLRTATINVVDSLGFILAEDVFSPIDMPPFPQSAMDGYALGPSTMFREHKQGSTFKVIGEVAAGSAVQFDLGQNEAVRIFTGAPVPETSSAVVQQEWVSRNKNTITLEKEVAKNMHIRPHGEQMKRNDIALRKGTLMNAAAIGFLSMLGISEIKVFAKPKVAVLVTGNELVAPGNPLEYGQIYESNASMLIAALRKEGIVSKTIRIPDDLNRTVEAIDTAFAENDIIILSGGISVGDHDHVGTALERLSVKEIFYKVKQKPGKPLFFGTKGDKAVFALPGNPAASLTCYYMYALPTIRKMQQHPTCGLEKRMMPLVGDYLKIGDRAVFLKAKIESDSVRILDSQSSAMLSSFAMADALVYFDETTSKVNPNDLAVVFVLP